MCSDLPWKLAFQLNDENSQAKLPIWSQHWFSFHKPSSNTPPQTSSLWQCQYWWVKHGQGVLLNCEHNFGHGFGHGFSPGQQAAPAQCLAGAGELPELSGCSNADVVRVWVMPRPFGPLPQTGLQYLLEEMQSHYLPFFSPFLLFFLLFLSSFFFSYFPPHFVFPSLFKLGFLFLLFYLFFF